VLIVEVVALAQGWDLRSVQVSSCVEQPVANVDDPDNQRQEQRNPQG